MIDNPSIGTANNRIKINQGYDYDAAGNLTAVPNRVNSSLSYKYEYDAEGRQVSFDKDPIGTPEEKDATYVYDGDGRRVLKVAGGVKTVFVYDASGKLVAEYSTAGAISNGTSYLTSDMLGTPRIITGSNINDSDAGVKARHDYLPFGEEVFVGRSGNYPGDSLRQKFTQYERDTETNLDYAQARYYSSALGRFTSVDPLISSGNPGDPATWNRYTYALNNPLKYTDPSGLDPEKKFWLTDGYNYYPVNKEQYDSMLKETYDDGSPVYTAVPAGTNIGKLTRLAGSLEFWMQNQMLRGSEVTLGEDGNFHQVRRESDCLNCEALIAGMHKYAAAEDLMKGMFFYMTFFTGPVGGGGGLTSLGLKGGGLSISSLGGAAAAPMTVVRTIGRGEKLGDIISEGKALTFLTENEHALVTLASGERALVSGGKGGINFASGQIKRLFGHTHPYGTSFAGPSALDRAAIKALGQRSSWLFEGGAGRAPFGAQKFTLGP